MGGHLTVSGESKRRPENKSTLEKTDPPDTVPSLHRGLSLLSSAPQFGTIGTKLAPEGQEPRPLTCSSNRQGAQGNTCLPRCSFQSHLPPSTKAVPFRATPARHRGWDTHQHLRSRVFGVWGTLGYPTTTSEGAGIIPETVHGCHLGLSAPQPVLRCSFAS